MGIYPMLRDETCYFLAADFDKGSWQEDAKAFLETCRQMNLPAVLERSRSGKGGHVWLFFDEAVPATLARKLGSHVLTETMERRPDLGLDSYDRFFPNQDTLPQGGFGNLIALPLAETTAGIRQQRFPGRCIWFLIADQWAFLSSVRKIGRHEIEAIVRARRSEGTRYRRSCCACGRRRCHTLEGAAIASPHGRPRLPDRCPIELELVLGNEIFIAKDGCLRLSATG